MVPRAFITNEYKHSMISKFSDEGKTERFVTGGSEIFLDDDAIFFKY
jgi:hypothetical protein